jgi:hypothetical protein
MTTPERGADVAAKVATAHSPGEFLGVDAWGNRVYAGTPLAQAFLTDKAKPEGHHVNGIYLDDADHDDPSPDESPDDGQPDVLADMRDGAWLDTQKFDPLQWTVPGIIPEGFGLLVAPPKAGKSWLAAGLGLASAGGGIALGAIAVGQRPVLYLALEDGYRRLQQRFRFIMANQPIPEGMHVIIRARTHEVIPMITEFLCRQCVPALVILDTLGKVKPPKRAGDDSYLMDYAIGTRLKDTADSSPGSTLLVIHHSRKAESSDFVDAVSGTQGIAGSADFVLVLSRKRHEDDALLAVTGRDIVENEYALQAGNGLWRLDGADLANAALTAETRCAATKLGDMILDVSRVVREAESVVSPTGVAAKLGINSKTASKYLSRLDDRGDIIKVGRGKYVSELSKVSKDKQEPWSDDQPEPPGFDTFDTDSDCSTTIPIDRHQ